MNKPFPSSPGPLHQNKVKCSAFDMELNFHSVGNKAHLHKKDCPRGLILKVRAFATRKWPIDSFIFLERRRRLDEETFAKTTKTIVLGMGNVLIVDWFVPSFDPRNNCGTH